MKFQRALHIVYPPRLQLIKTNYQFCRMEKLENNAELKTLISALSVNIVQ